MTLLGLEWYWWLVIAIILVISIPFKIKFMKWWGKRQQEKKNSQRGKWGRLSENYGRRRHEIAESGCTAAVQDIFTAH